MKPLAVTRGKARLTQRTQTQITIATQNIHATAILTQIRGMAINEMLYLPQARLHKEHHIFGGANRKKKSERDGLKVDLCMDCHRTGKHAVHKDAEVMLRLHQYGQTALHGKSTERQRKNL